MTNKDICLERAVITEWNDGSGRIVADGHMVKVNSCSLTPRPRFNDDLTGRVITDVRIKVHQRGWLVRRANLVSQEGA